jgi:hypothetical protein
MTWYLLDKRIIWGMSQIFYALPLFLWTLRHCICTLVSEYVR